MASTTASQVGSECPVTSDSPGPQRVSITREELEALIEEAVRQERARR